jgi:hypothetical protein
MILLSRSCFKHARECSEQTRGRVKKKTCSTSSATHPNVYDLRRVALYKKQAHMPACKIAPCLLYEHRLIICQ